ncbi:NAD(P)/FAD-dependent oxidoreductase [Rhodoferax saidenbachensis]|uniref:Ferredoxin--NADP reductase n=1 Tax=Rhodoferax saidenbachensis TaxID=1484693 RepID=A0ABU1ZKP9_9BURK|nr:NAD(P)/FAD-dependent oxidoreductase [Rhodoferax saidenbachensis]MDR7305116.1 thioredoxin reductase (NADPH) [Rhodoferax saidenbachensis]
MAAPLIEADAVVIGAGPVGLFQVFQLGLLEVKTHVIDVLPYAGGQCVELYADKPIYDIPAVPVTTGSGLTESLLQQIGPFGAQMHFGRQVASVQRQDDSRIHLTTTSGQAFLTKALFIASGVGAFVARSLHVDGIAQFEGSQLHYRTPPVDSLSKRHVVIHGGSDAALECALQVLAPDNTHRPASVTLVHRRDVFVAEADTLARVQALRASGTLRFVAAQITGFEAADGVLKALQILDAEGKTRALPADQVLAFLGVSPKMGPIADWGLAMERKQLAVNTEDFGTNVPGIFAVGDINTYPGKKKLILCGFHEATLAAYGAMPFIFPEKKVMLQYTTTSPRLHALLGVQTPQKNA